MARKRTGTVQAFKDGSGKPYYRARIRLGDGSRHWARVPETKGYSKERAKEWAAWLQGEEEAKGAILAARRESIGAIAPPESETVGKWVARWIEAREARGHTSTRDDRSRFATYVFPSLEHKAMRAVTRADIEAIVEALDKKVHAGTLSWRTAWNVWAVLSKAFRDAWNAKQRDLRVRDDNPCERVAPPDRGIKKSKAFIFPSEFLAVMNCPDVDLEWRRLIALAVYIFPRAGELEALEWSDIDLDRGVVHIHRGTDRERGGSKGTKTGMARRFNIEPALLPVLHAMRDEAGGDDASGPIVRMPRMRDLAEGLRTFLGLAGVDRDELFADDETRKQLTWHDLRATGCTWMAVRGDEPLHIQYRAGHTSFSTTQLYIRQAEAVRDGFGEVFPALAMLTGTDERSTSGLMQSWRRGIYSRKLAERAGFEGGRRGRDATRLEKTPAASSNASDVESRKSASPRDVDTANGPLDDALTKALEAATIAGRFDVVAQLAREIEARRLARAGNVVKLEPTAKGGRS